MSTEQDIVDAAYISSANKVKKKAKNHKSFN